MSTTKNQGTRARAPGKAARKPTMMQRRRKWLERPATKENLLSFLDREHMRVFGVEWDPRAEVALSAVRKTFDIGDGRVITFPGHTPRAGFLPKSEEERIAEATRDDRPGWDDVLAEAHQETRRALDRARRAARALVHLKVRLARTRWDENEAEEILFDHLVAVVEGLPEVLASASSPPWMRSRSPSRRAAIVRNAPKAYPDVKLTAQKLAVVSLLCGNGWRPDALKRRTSTIGAVLEREADAMRKAMVRRKSGH